MLSDNRKYRKFTSKQKVGELVLAATERFESGQDRPLAAEQRRRIAQLERALGRKIYELEIALRGWE